jgi:hypothetical protein
VDSKVCHVVKSQSKKLQKEMLLGSNSDSCSSIFLKINRLYCTYLCWITIKGNLSNIVHFYLLSYVHHIIATCTKSLAKFHQLVRLREAPWNWRCLCAKCQCETALKLEWIKWHQKIKETFKSSDITLKKHHSLRTSKLSSSDKRVEGFYILYCNRYDENDSLGDTPYDSP